jgi:hypothetical protein
MDTSDVYKEACLMLRHYSNSSLAIRIAVIAQGIIILSGGGYLFRVSEFAFVAVAAFFGLLFTFILLMLHINYRNKCIVFIQVARQIELKITESSERVITIYDIDHRNRNNNFTSEVFVVNGFFYFMFLAFTGLLVCAIYMLIG